MLTWKGEDNESSFRCARVGAGFVGRDHCFLNGQELPLFKMGGRDALLRLDVDIDDLEPGGYRVQLTNALTSQ